MDKTHPFEFTPLDREQYVRSLRRDILLHGKGRMQRRYKTMVQNGMTAHAGLIREVLEETPAPDRADNE